jgi:ABC-type dipeptide/oligopeptide/nickel transport system permease component
MLRAVATGAALLTCASVLVFALVRSAPGDPIDIEFGRSEVEALLTPEQQAATRAARERELGLDSSLVVQYLRWIGPIVRGDLGISFRTGRPVAAELAERLPASVVLGVSGFAVSLAGAGLVAVLSARRPGGPVDHVLRPVSLSLASVPTFLLGSLALRVAAEHVGYPIAGDATARRLWLPALVVGLAGIPTLARVLRAALITEYARPYAQAARARGASAARLTLRHVLRPALGPLMTLAGLNLASLVAGTVITEAVFSWPGISAYALTAISARDYPAVQGYLLLVVVIVVTVNRSVDVLQHLLDPRPKTAAGPETTS